MSKKGTTAAGAKATGAAGGAIAGTNSTAAGQPEGTTALSEGSTSPAEAVKAVQDVTVTHVQVRALTNGFRRAGRAWAATEVTVPIDELSEGQVAQLMAEPMLSVLLVSDGEVVAP